MGRDATYNHIRYVVPGVRVFLAVPNLAFQRSSRTNIGALALYDRAVWLRPLIEAARNVKNKIRRTSDTLRIQRSHKGLKLGTIFLL